MYPAPVIIQPVSALLVALATPIHPTLLPFGFIPVLHAFRISIVYRSLSRKAGGNSSVAANLVGFLLMAWGGSIVSHILLSLPIPQLLSFTPLLVYATTHFCLPDIRNLPSLKTLDSIFPLVDALLRTTAIAAGVEACRNHPSPAISGSLSIQLFIGAVASSAGGISAQTLSVWEPSWRLNRPIFLQEGTMLAGTDVWSGTLSSSIPKIDRSTYSADSLNSPLLSSTDAKATAASILTLIYCWRVYNVHHLPKIGGKTNKAAQDSKSKEE
ncbi:hypothetical protein PSHT_12975 [Puccinia striiformis]|uniref:Uncharacterized protein n=1 Tax=Puccinia striiformis TaxID=27350 RepID=A0A2S4UTJ0_9BASI|nr:hypothetical protein PSHT_12975 [Puccinia striiformis]